MLVMPCCTVLWIAMLFGLSSSPDGKPLSAMFFGLFIKRKWVWYLVHESLLGAAGGSLLLPRGRQVSLQIRGVVRVGPTHGQPKVRHHRGARVGAQHVLRRRGQRQALHRGRQQVARAVALVVRPLLRGEGPTSGSARGAGGGGARLGLRLLRAAALAA